MGMFKGQKGDAHETPAKIRRPTMKFGVFANLITGKQLYSSHRLESAAKKAAARLGKKGASFTVLPIKK